MTMSSPTDAAQGQPSLSGAERDRLASRVRLTRLGRALDWATSLVPSPFGVTTSCCGMSLAQGGDLFEALGTGPPAMSARSADLLIVAGSLTHKQVPLLRELYERMVEPRWVMAWGVCAISGGPYQNYATIPGVSEVLPVDVHVTGCPPLPEDFRTALALLHERAAGTRPSGGGPSRSSQTGWMPIEQARTIRREIEADR